MVIVANHLPIRAVPDGHGGHDFDWDEDALIGQAKVSSGYAVARLCKWQKLVVANRAVDRVYKVHLPHTCSSERCQHQMGPLQDRTASVALLPADRHSGCSADGS